MGSKPLVEDCLTLDLAWLMRLKPIRVGQVGTGKISWARDGHSFATAQFRLDLQSEETARLVLSFVLAPPQGNHKPVRQTIALSAIPQHFGGFRWWMHCPVTGERVRNLHLPPNGAQFAGRKALGLCYRVERLSRFDRPFEKVFRTQRRLHAPQGLGAGLTRPKGMWNRTFARHVAAIKQHDRACLAQIAHAIKNPR